MKKRLARVLVLVLVAAMILAAGCGGKSSQGGEGQKDAKAGGEVIKIGALFPFSGNLAVLGEESFRGAEIARQVINGKGGINGKKIEFVKADAVDAKAAVAEAERLITKEGVKIIIGTYSSTLSYAATEVAERNGIIYWELGAVADDITSRGYKYLFRVAPRAREYGSIGATYAATVVAPALKKDPKDLKVAIVYEDGLYGTTVSKFAKSKAEELGLKVVAYEAYSTKSVDLSPLVMKLKEAKPDVLLATQYLTDLLLLWKQSKQLDFKVPVIIGTGGAHSNKEFIDAVGANEAEGVMNVGFSSLGVNSSFGPGLEDFLKLYKDKYGREATSAYPHVNYAGTQILFKVIEQAGSVDPEKIRQAALKVDLPVGSTMAGWGAKFAGPDTKEVGQNLNTSMIIDQWQGGKQVVVWPDNAIKPGVKPIIPLPSWKQ
ncbi:MAG: ABC transporter substrate-binding protein [Actinobacteria bacterium]|nr:ABC transporter substrate-binding protein [Actinomycetota bacterium]